MADFGSPRDGINHRRLEMIAVNNAVRRRVLIPKASSDTSCRPIA
jgi:hypothetical protein